MGGKPMCRGSKTDWTHGSDRYLDVESIEQKTGFPIRKTLGAAPDTRIGSRKTLV